MKLNKEKFFKTELGQNLKECVTAWDRALITLRECSISLPQTREEYRRALQTVLWCQAQWEVYQLMLKQIYGISCHFYRTDSRYGNDYFGIVLDGTSDTEFLFKVERNGENE